MNSHSRRVFIVSHVAGLACMALIIGGLSWSLYRAGSFKVQVDELGPGGEYISISLPAALLDAGLIFMPKAAYAAISDEMGDELCEFWPVLTAACEELARCLDCVLVRVESDDEFVLVAKRGRSLHIEVESDDESIRVVIPLGTVSSFLKRIERAS